MSEEITPEEELKDVSNEMLEYRSAYLKAREEIATLKTCLLAMQNANVSLCKQLDEREHEIAELKTTRERRIIQLTGVDHSMASNWHVLALCSDGAAFSWNSATKCWKAYPPIPQGAL